VVRGLCNIITATAVAHPATTIRGMSDGIEGVVVTSGVSCPGEVRSRSSVRRRSRTESAMVGYGRRFLWSAAERTRSRPITRRAVRVRRLPMHMLVLERER